ncbi:helix-turn-helix transcriptional regulator [Gillisia sp. M10.2A]|uniref:Helix-turn-helix transcriptional regulator n=1 Tax=Gillisia lutea TaxID=2909668 RepID=A0ABS9EIM5_9FLAO|nr:helix-turn-helix transcriptional regulator [Gillisia lutea]MCF4101714.1 helix-turn-helix transcriptional regulator [Gillisia lutea]
MVNSEKFSKRLQEILNYYDISAAAFADAIEVGRSSISHIISGRNKPSLDFVLKIVETYPEVELYWLLNGKGSFPGNPNKKETASPSPLTSTTPIRTQIKESAPLPPAQNNYPISTDSVKDIKKIVIFYTDGSFEAFEN